MSDLSDEIFDTTAFRRALGSFATGVAVATARAEDGSMVGMTISSFNSVSLDPPLVLFSIARSAWSLPALRAAKAYGVNILGRDQIELSNRFARPSSDKWSAVAHESGPHGAPLLCDAIARFECVPHACHDGGDHLIFLARVVRFERTQSDAPLLFFGGRYRALDTAWTA